MATGSTYARWIAVAVLVPLCAWLVYRNLLGPGDARLAGGQPRDDSSRSAALGLANPPSRTSASSNRGGPGAPLSQEELAALDPTLREDLLERSRRIAYTGSSRNIFQYYTPPPPPAPPAPPPAPPPAEAAAVRPAQPPPPPPIALKFYGIASPPGAGEKRAFLIDGEEIIIAKEGDTIGRFYKVIRIGVNSIELEDSRSQRRQSLELPEDK